MTRKQLQTLISAGVFSAAILAGAAYAEDANQQGGGTGAPAATPAATPTPPIPPKPKHMSKKHKKGMDKQMAKHGCAGKNDCKGQGGCKTSDGGCAGKNSCKGKGGCATDGTKMPS